MISWEPPAAVARCVQSLLLPQTCRNEMRNYCQQTREDHLSCVRYETGQEQWINFPTEILGL